jgi:hypothetical protein
VTITDVTVQNPDEEKIRKTVNLLLMRQGGVLDKKSAAAIALLLKGVPDGIRTQAEARVQAKLTDNQPLPSTAGLTPMEQTLLTGALEKLSIDEAVVKIYDNMHKLTNWQYKGSEKERDGKAYTKRGKTVGMCESYREAFKEALLCYDTLRKQHPNSAIRDGQLDIVDGQDLTGTTFVTPTGLTLMGNKIKGNVCLVVDGRGEKKEEGFDAINRFMFTYHWTLKVNGKNYDPIFYSIDGKSDDIVLNEKTRLAPDGSRFIPNRTIKIPTGEFDSSLVWVTDWAQFDKTMNALIALYTKYREDVDDIVAGTKSTQEGVLSKTDRKCYKEAKKLVDENVTDPQTFQDVIAGLPDIFIRGSQRAGIGQVLKLASM